MPIGPGGGGGGGGAVSSVFGRTGAVVAATGDYTAPEVGALSEDAYWDASQYADASGATDASAAIQALINDNTKPIYFPPGGNYQILAGLTLLDGTRLFGPSFANGYGGVAVPATRARLFLETGATVPMISVTVTDSHVDIEGLILDGNAVAQNVIEFPASGTFHDYFSRVRGCYIVNIGAAVYGIYAGNNTGSVYIEDCTIYQGTATGGSGVYFSTSSGWIVNTLFNGFIGASQNAVYNLNGYNNRFINCDFGVNNVAITTNAEETLIMGCFFDRNEYEAILINVGGVQIIGCQFHSNSQHAANAAPDITVAPGLENIVIVGNYFGPLDGGIVNTASYGFYVNGTSFVTAHGNTVYAGSRGVGLTQYTGVQTSPTVPASGTAFASLGYDAFWIFTDTGTGTSIALDGITYDILAGATQSIFVRANGAPVPSYTTAPTVSIVNV